MRGLGMLFEKGITVPPQHVRHLEAREGHGRTPRGCRAARERS